MLLEVELAKYLCNACVNSFVILSTNSQVEHLSCQMADIDIKQKAESQ